jgi:hypothetical protein
MTPAPVAKSHAAAFSMPLLREATFNDYDAITELERANGLKSRSRTDWLHLWTENPLYRQLGSAFPIGWVLEEEATGRIVGTLSNVPLPYVFNGRHVLAATGRGWAVDPPYRAFAPLLFDEYVNQNADILLSTTVNGLAEASHSTEELRVPVGDWSRAAFRITNYSGFAKVALKIKSLPGVLAPLMAMGLWAKDRLTKRLAQPKIPGQLSVTEFSEFGPAFDDLWRELQAAKAGKLLGVRSSEVLGWHFGIQLRSKRARILAVTGADGRIAAYAVLMRADHHASGLKRFRLADFQTLDPALTDALVAKALQVCREDGVHALEMVGCDVPALDRWESVMPYRRNLPAWCYYFRATNDTLAAQFQEAAAWEPSSFDGDSSI